MVLVIVVVVKENVFFEDLSDVVAQNHSNNLGRYSKVRTTLLQ